MISLDTETTGVDLFHGAKPFFVTVCREGEDPTFWEWPVDPLTREPQIPKADLEEIRVSYVNGSLGKVLNIGPMMVLQNAKFDVKALATIGLTDWNWNQTHDTLIAGHLLASNHKHDLTSMVLEYLGVDIQPYEDRLEKVVKECRTLAKREFPEWMLAGKDCPGMPSAKEKTWKYDTWLPMALVRVGASGNDMETVLSDYACADSFFTLQLWKVMESELHRRGLWELYQERMKAIPIAFEMEQSGITVSKTRLGELRADYQAESEQAGSLCVNIASTYMVADEESAENEGGPYELSLPKSGNNLSLGRFLFDVMGLPVLARTETGKPALDKATLEQYEATLPEDSKELAFVKALRGKRKRDTALAYLDGYERYWLPIYDEWHVLHPSLNPTGTDTLRWSSSNPNEQNISKQEGFNLRHCFGPVTGKEWWSLDYQNLELRIPAFEAGETDLMHVFEHPKDPPYYGSYHLVVFDALFPELFKQHGKECKNLYESTYYQWTKNGNFAMIYGAQRGTADGTYHKDGAYDLLQRRFPKIAQLNQRMIEHANRHGYVETIPDKTVNPLRGYPIICSRTLENRVMPTVPLNYHVQSTAMWCTMKAMIRCHERLREDGSGGRLVMQVHDELVIEYPRRGNPKLPGPGSNLGRVRDMQRLMAMSGDDIGVPTPTSAEWHPKTWAEGVQV